MVADAVRDAVAPLYAQMREIEKNITLTKNLPSKSLNSPKMRLRHLMFLGSKRYMRSLADCQTTPKAVQRFINIKP